MQAGQFDGVKRELLETIQFRAQQLGILLVPQGVARQGFQSELFDAHLHSLIEPEILRAGVAFCHLSAAILSQVVTLVIGFNLR